MSQDVTQNKRLLLIMGETGTGKSASLREIENPTGVLYLNCEAGKDLPFRDKFRKEIITDPNQIFDLIDEAEEDPKIHTVVIDSISMLMEMYESVHIIGATDTRSKWVDYNQFVKELMQQYIATSEMRFIVLAHTNAELNEETGIREVSIPVKGALKKNGLEAFFSVAVATKKVPTKKLAKYKNDLLNITPREEAVGFKYVFQTLPTKETIGERMRGPFDLFTDEETFIDNNAGMLLDVLDEYHEGD